MQNRYVGDIGDYVKLAILRQLARGKLLGVAWWLFPDESHNNDGGHREYLERRDEWREFDPDLFDALWKIGEQKERNVRALEDPTLLPNATFGGGSVPCRNDRQPWLLDLKAQFKDRTLIFLDPDNGLAPDGLITRRRAGKSGLIGDIAELRKSHQTMVVYHHQTRRKGGHEAELRYLARRLREEGFRVSGALRAKPWSPRAFLILDGDEEVNTQAHRIAEIWRDKIFWYPDTWLFSETPDYDATQ